MIYFITGATGFIGAALTKRLADEGHEIRALVRNKEKAKIIQHRNVSFYYGTITNQQLLAEAIKGVDGIFHLAAIAKPYVRNKSLYYTINIAASASIFKLAMDHHVKRVVFTSSAGTFGPSTSQPVHEQTLRSLDFFNEYESTKYMAEKVAKDFVLEGADIVIVHPSRVYGPGLISKSNAVTLMIKKYIGGMWRIIPGDGKKVGNYVFIKDVVDGHISAMQFGKSGKQYLLGGENYSYEDFFKLLQVVSHKNYKLVKIPVWILKSFAAIQMQLALLFRQSPLLPPKWVKKYLYNWEVSSDKAEQELSYHITSLEEGFRRTIDWLKNNEK
jgi:farnesol dehydrogenase